MAGFPRTARLRSGEDFKRGLKARRRGSGRWFTASSVANHGNQGAARYCGRPTCSTAGHAPQSNQTDHAGAFPAAGGRTRSGGCGSQAAYEAFCRRHGAGRGGSRTPLAGARLMKHLLSLLIRGYQLAVSPFFGASCRFHPSCSEYAREAIMKHGVAARRVAGRATAGALPPLASRRHRRGAVKLQAAPAFTSMDSYRLFVGLVFAVSVFLLVDAWMRDRHDAQPVRRRRPSAKRCGETPAPSAATLGTVETPGRHPHSRAGPQGAVRGCKRQSGPAERGADPGSDRLPDRRDRHAWR